jgi:hypothetical protein
MKNRTAIFFTTVGAGLAIIAAPYEWYIPAAIVALVTAAYFGYNFPTS